MKLIYALLNLGQKITKDKVNLYSATSSFFMIVSFFPFIMLLFNILKYTSITESYVLTLVAEVIPTKVQPLVISIIDEIYNSSSFTLLSVTAISALWAAGKGFVSIIQGLNDIYDTGGETRNYFVLRFHSTIYTLILFVTIILLLVMMVFGNNIHSLLSTWWPFLDELVSLVLKFKILIFAALLMIFFAIIYRFVPNRKAKLIKQLPGAIFASIGWIGFSMIFSLYVDFSLGFTTTYGSLGTLVFIMVWLYTCMYILFLGGEINAFINKDKFI